MLYHERASRVPTVIFSAPSRVLAGHASIALRLSGGKTVLAEAVAASPLRLLTPRNHGCGAWVYLASFGGGLVDGDSLDVRVDAAAGTCAVIATQAPTKVYRSPRGCSHKFDLRAAEGSAVPLIPHP